MQQVRFAFKTSSRTSAIWLTGGLEATMYIALYALKAFLPIYALSAGINVAVVGLFFSFQEATHLILKPWSGRLGDRVGHVRGIAAGMLILGLTIPSITYVTDSVLLLFSALLLGLAEALISPSAIALASTQLHGDNIGAGMGFIGMQKNAGKVAGPILAGILIGWSSYEATFYFIGILLLIGAVALILFELLHRRKERGYMVSVRGMD